MTIEQKSMICSEVKASGKSSKFISLQQLQELVQGNEIHVYLLTELVELAVRYAETVIQFQELALTNKKDFLAEVDVVRKRTHDSFNDSVNILARTLGKDGKDNSWIDPICRNRASYGMFALVLTFHWLQEIQQ